jgi:Kef-type K+ transport system membrane component KefB
MRLISRRDAKLTLIYLGLLAFAGASFLAVISWGGPSLHHAGVFNAARLPPTSEAALQLLRALLALLLTSSLLGALCRWMHQPSVIGEILAGICLGPSILGRLAPSARDYLVPANVASQLGTLSQIGVILFMFLVGLEVDLSVMRSKSRATLAISHASILVPFVLGSVAAIWLYPTLGTATTSFPVFALFLGVSLSVTAFPVLARILTDNALNRTPMGVMALTCAAVDDVTAWCLLALLVGIAKTSAWDGLVTCVSTAAYVAALFYMVRPLLGSWARAQREQQSGSRRAVILVLLALLLSSLITEQIGIHAIFGAFLLGAMIPHDSAVASALKSKFQDLVVVLFMPAFYALIGMRTQLGLVDGFRQWLTCGVIIAIACLGKFGGSYVAARLVGVKERDAASVAILMNTRGLMELVVLDLGLSLGVISPTLFSMMVIMALVTTLLTSPLLRLTHGLAAQSAAARGALSEEPT